MNFLKLFLLLTMTIAIAITVSAASSEPSNEENTLTDDNDPAEPSSESQEMISLRGPSRFLAQKTVRARMTCNNYPRMCHLKGSPGPDCCKKKCVNVFTDRLNCGKCGQKCKYYETCCKGKCVNTFSNKKHCGGCDIKCKKGSSCVYGMCSYA